MALNADNVRVGLNGNVYVAPKGTTAPADLTSAWDPAWKDLGYLNDDGVEMEYGTDVEDIMAWQSLSPVRARPHLGGVDAGVHRDRAEGQRGDPVLPGLGDY